jgi:structure-specific endonuclease subunit SLX1
MQESFVYLLESTRGSIYIGATMDVNRRLRQHNKEIVGGAKKTGIRVEKGEEWSRICYVSGFPSWTAALQFEWRFKRMYRKFYGTPYPNVQRALRGLQRMMALEQSTAKAVPFSQWAIPPQIIWDRESARVIYQSLPPVT